LVWVLFARGPYRFLVLGATGLVAGLLCSGSVGPGCAGGLAVGYLLVRADARLHFDRLAGRVLAVWAGATLMALVEVVLRGLLGELDSWTYFGITLRRAFGVGLYTAAVGIPVLMVVGWLHSSRLMRLHRRRDDVY
jgi:hypothetical protein